MSSSGGDAARTRAAELWLGITVFVLMPTALTVFDARYHEFWRDEAQAELIARNAHFPTFFSVIHVEGVPFLFHLMLKALSVVFSPVGALLVGGWIGFEILLFGTFRLVQAICGNRLRSLVAALLLGLTYNYAYEFGAVIRPYGMSIGFAMLAMALLRDSLRTGERSLVLLGSLAAGFGAATTSHAACLCGGALVAFFLCAIARRQLGWGTLFALATALPCFAITAYLALPFPGRTSALDRQAHSTALEAFSLARQAITGSFTPQDWWVAASFGDPKFLNALARFRGWTPVGVALAAAITLIARGRALWNARALEWFDVLAICVGWVPLAEIIVNHYWGSPRHHLMFSVPAVTVVVGWVLASRWTFPLAFLFVPFFCFQWTMAWLDFRLDARLPFSDTKEAASKLPPRARVVADSSIVQEAYLLWRPDIQLRGTDQRGRITQYTISDPDWFTRVPVGPLLSDACAEAPDRVYYSGAFPPAPSCMTQVMQATKHNEQFRADEETSLWKVDCACANGRH